MLNKINWNGSKERFCNSKHDAYILHYDLTNSKNIDEEYSKNKAIVEVGIKDNKSRLVMTNPNLDSYQVLS